MKRQKGGRISMPYEYFNPDYKGPWTSNPAPATLARGVADASGCTMGPLPLQVAGAKRRRGKRGKKMTVRRSKKGRRATGSRKGKGKGAKRSRRR